MHIVLETNTSVQETNALKMRVRTSATHIHTHTHTHTHTQLHVASSNFQTELCQDDCYSQVFTPKSQACRVTSIRPVSHVYAHEKQSHAFYVWDDISGETFWIE